MTSAGPDQGLELIAINAFADRLYAVALAVSAFGVTRRLPRKLLRLDCHGIAAAGTWNESIRPCLNPGSRNVCVLSEYPVGPARQPHPQRAQNAERCPFVGVFMRRSMRALLYVYFAVFPLTMLAWLMFLGWIAFKLSSWTVSLILQILASAQ